MKSPKRDKRTNLEKEIDKSIDRISNLEPDSTEEVSRIIDVMSTMSPDSDEYSNSLKSLEKVMKLRDIKREEAFQILDTLLKAKNDDKSRGVNKELINKLLVVFGNNLGIVLILNYEKMGVVASKALGFVIKGRV